jgi:uncharacterized protein involved in exopolysaccharide biosynthesis
MGLGDYLSIFRTRRWIIIGTMLGVAALAGVLSTLQPPTYRGEARVLLTEQNPGTALLGAPQADQMTQQGDVETQVEIVASHALLQRVIDKLSLRTTVDSLARQVSVSVVGQTNIMAIDVRDQDPGRAIQTAKGLAEEYVAWSRDVRRASIQSAAHAVEASLAQVRIRIVELERSQETSAGDFQTDLATAKNLSATLAGQLQTLQMSQQLETGQGVVMPTTAADVVRTGPNPLQNAGLGAAFGFVLALGVAFGANRLDTTIRSSDEAEVLYGAPVLGHIPTEKPPKGESRWLALLRQPRGPAAEAFRMLASNANFLQVHRGIKTLLIASAEKGGQVDGRRQSRRRPR